VSISPLLPDPTFAGRSLTPFVRDETPEEWRDTLFTQCDGVELFYSQRSVRTAAWHYVFNGFDEDELYNRRLDPGQTMNRIHEPALAPDIRDLCQRWWRFAAAHDDTMFNPYWTVGIMPHGPADGLRVP